MGYHEDDTPKDIPVYVPKGTAELYKMDFGWKYFNNFIETEFAGIEGVEADGSRADDTIYDLNGNVVAHPLPNQLYIRNGKKFIFR